MEDQCGCVKGGRREMEAARAGAAEPASANWTGPCTIWIHWPWSHPTTRRRLLRQGQESERSKPNNRRLPLGQTDRASSDRQGEAVGGCMPPQLKTPPELLFLTPTQWMPARCDRYRRTLQHMGPGEGGIATIYTMVLALRSTRARPPCISDTIRDPSTEQSIQIVIIVTR